MTDTLNAGAEISLTVAVLELDALRQRHKAAVEVARLAVETLDDDAPGPGLTITQLLEQLRAVLKAEQGAGAP